MRTVATKKTDTRTAGRLQREMLALAESFIPAEDMDATVRTLVVGGRVRLPDRRTHYEVKTGKGLVTLDGYSTGGTYHSLTVHNNGQCTVVHDGARTSYPGMLMDISRNNSEFFDSESWTLSIYVTSEPGWAPVAGFLSGEFGSNAPANAWEAEGGHYEKN